MTLPFNSDLVLTTSYGYEENGAASGKSIANLRLQYPEMINSMVTFAYGKGGEHSSSKFPMLFNLAGKGRKKAIKSLDLSYQSKMYGRPKKTDQIAKTIPGQTKAGQYGEFFKAYFTGKFFMKNEVISCGGLSRAVLAHVYGEPIKIASNLFEYTLKLAGVPHSSFCPPEHLKKGATWGIGVVKVSLERSRGTDQRKPQTPFTTTNQLSVVRKSFSYLGNVANKRINIPLQTSTGTINTWHEWELYNNELLFNEAKNEDLIFSQYNRNADGSIQNLDSDTNEPVPMGAGMWQQITNEVTFNQLTKSKLDAGISNMLESNQIGGNDNSGEYVIVGGTGLLMEVNKVLSSTADRYLTYSDKFVRGTDSMNLEFGAYFTRYKHSSGKTIAFTYDPSFDFGAKAQTAERHPKYPEKSVLSFCGMALDFSDVEVSGKSSSSASSIESNIVLTYEEGREYLDWLVLGGSQIPNVNMETYKSRASDIDASSMHMMSTQGCHINYPNNCTKFICTIS